MGNDIVKTNPLAVMPVMDIELAKQRRQAIINFASEMMIEGTDYGKVPGTKKDTLLKPGAEKLTTLFGLSPQFQIVEKCEDWTGKDHGGEPFFYFQYKCQLYRGDLLAGEGVGSCNSWEKNYRFRKASRTCPGCGETAIIKGKEEYGGGWLCWKRNGGCGAKFSDGDESIESQEVGTVKNDNPQDQVNTIDKIAQKRALVAATLIAVNASEFFTQDVEDLSDDIIEGEFTEPKKEQPKQQATKRQDNQWEAEILDVALDLNLVEKRERAVGILNNSPLMAVPYHKLDTAIGLAYIMAYNTVKEEFPKDEKDERRNKANVLWNESKDELIANAGDLLGRNAE